MSGEGFEDVGSPPRENSTKSLTDEKVSGTDWSLEAIPQEQAAILPSLYRTLIEHLAATGQHSKVGDILEHALKRPPRARPVGYRIFFGPDVTESVETASEIRTGAVRSNQTAIERENQELKLQIELLKSRVQEQRRTAARETQRYDQLSAHHGELQSTVDELTSQLHSEADANKSLLRVLIAHHAKQVCLSEVYEGVVKGGDARRVVVVYEVGDDLVEQIYSIEQFLEGNVPSVGDRLVVCVHVAQLCASPEEDAEAEDARDTTYEQPRPRKNVVTLPREF